MNRSDPAALVVASNGAKAGIPIEGSELRKLVGTLWFRGVVPKLSPEWRTRILEALIDNVEVPNHAVRVGRRAVHLSELNYDELQELSRTSVPEVIRTDLDLLLTVGRLWGGEAIGRFRFSGNSPNHAQSKLVSLLQGFRS